MSSDTEMECAYAEEEHDSPEEEYKYTEEELDEMIKKIWIKDCKIDACLDKFFSRLVPLNRNYFRDWRKQSQSFDSFVEDVKTELEGSEPLKQELCSDIDTFVPKYFDKLESTATVDDKFSSLGMRLMKAFQRWFNSDGDSQHGKEEFDDALISMLADRHFEKLKTDSRLSSGEASDRPASLHQISSTQVLEQLRFSIEGEQATASFACGGSIAVGSSVAENSDSLTHGGAGVEDQEVKKNAMAQTHDGHPSQTDTPAETKTSGIFDAPAPYSSAPISIYWSPEGNENAKRLSLPLEKTDESSTDALQGIVHDCTPATFGRGNKDVLDPEYRSAGKLDTDNFCTTFHPADFGILETIEQILLPSVSSSRSRGRFRRVRAELYKLNVYSGPSGIFRKHVDTPRSPYQFGSLVVCLPSPHEGGTLLVRHNGQDVEFDWSRLSSSRIQWAAFYSDCEHEITRVSKGHRLTLTYNLLIAEPIGASLAPNPVVDPKNFPLYSRIKNLLEQPGFFKDGGVMGFFCSHSYAHASNTAAIDLPRNLKGSDMVLFAVLQSLGLPVKVLPVLDDEYDDDDYYQETYFEQFRKKGYTTKSSYYGCVNEVDKKRRGLQLSYKTMCDYNYDYDDIEKRWKTLLMGRIPLGRGLTAKGLFVGKKLHPRETTDMGGEDCPSDEVVRECWPNYFLPGITWVTSPKEEVAALTHITYGNEASIETHYSSAAIIAVVPSWSQRPEINA